MKNLKKVFYSPACIDQTANITLLNVSCSNAGGGITEGGLSNSLAYCFSILSNLEKETKNPSDPSKILGYIESISSVSESNQVLLIQELLANFSGLYNDTLQSQFTRVAQTSLWINLVLLASLTSFFLAGWALFMLRFEKRIKSSKDVLSLLPAMILTQNMRVSKFLQEIIHDISRGTN